jgi:hypothetical protein
MAFDTWKQIYQYYHVLGSKITVQALPPTTNGVPGYFGITLTASPNDLVSTYGNNVNAMLESKLTTSSRFLSGNSNSAVAPTVISKTFSAKKFFTRRTIVDDDSLGAVVSNNPINQAYFTLWAASVNGSDPGLQTYQVKIDYIVRFHEPQLMQQDQPSLIVIPPNTGDPDTGGPPEGETPAASLEQPIIVTPITT